MHVVPASITWIYFVHVPSCSKTITLSFHIILKRTRRLYDDDILAAAI